MKTREGEKEGLTCLRIGKTTRAGEYVRKNCNISCLWCHDDLFRARNNSVAISNHELLAICMKIASVTGKDLKIRIAGNGEPTLMGGELTDLVAKLRRAPQVRHISLTTNGTLLKGMVENLKDVGLDSITVSINSLDEKKYTDITGRKFLPVVLEGLRTAVKSGVNVKVNTVFTKYCEEELDDFIKLSNDYGIVVKFFELIGDGALSYIHSPISGLMKGLESRAHEIMPYDLPYNGVIYKIDNAVLDVKDSFTANHCPVLDCPKRADCNEGCRRYVRVGADGVIEPCGARKDNCLDMSVPTTDEQIFAALRAGGKL